MASTVITNAYRARLADASAGLAPLAPYAYMAFGDGGHRPDGTPRPANADATALAHELARRPLAAITRPTAYTVECEGQLLPGELVGASISEAALLDAEGHVVAIKTFAPKVRDSDELYQVFIEPLF